MYNQLQIFLISLFVVLSFISPVLLQEVNQQNKRISKINKDPGLHWVAGVNTHFGRDNLEDRPWLANLQYEPISKPKTFQSHSPLSNLPDNFDARSNWPQCKTIGNIYTQGLCGCCYIFGGIQALSDRYCIATKGAFNQELSVQHLLNCDSLDNHCGGGHIEYLWDYFRYFGATTEECSGPYVGKQMKCNFNSCTDGKPAVRYYSKKPYTVGPDQEQIKEEIYTNGPVEACFTLYNDFDLYKGGVYQPSKDAVQIGGHCIKIIGWGIDSKSELPYWTCVNTFGKEWGENGTFRILRGSDCCNLESGIACGMPDVDHSPIPEPPQPKGYLQKTMTFEKSKLTYINNELFITEKSTVINWLDGLNKKIRYDTCGLGSGMGFGYPPLKKRTNIDALSHIYPKYELSIDKIAVGNPKSCSSLIVDYANKKEYGIGKYFGKYTCSEVDIDQPFPDETIIIPTTAVFVNYTMKNAAITALWVNKIKTSAYTETEWYWTSIESIDDHSAPVSVIAIQAELNYPTKSVIIVEYVNLVTIMNHVDDNAFDVSNFNCT
ncbi:tubulointerstitial nephritis antigen-like [Anaeramoeba flamelloides]|uniref:Tubulointerstitial nephritis antigen-like n=1 Tax=Anaeramoeba flamelloides TaxID=1746091 RepID=A0AAV7Y1X0_9EUKA|nr:tubulointerstitial nephritis antigen-like [Anaeramoeba flamelloides]